VIYTFRALLLATYHQDFNVENIESRSPYPACGLLCFASYALCSWTRRVQRGPRSGIAEDFLHRADTYSIDRIQLQSLILFIEEFIHAIGQWTKPEFLRQRSNLAINRVILAERHSSRTLEKLINASHGLLRLERFTLQGNPEVTTHTCVRPFSH
jgi:hypothetical protein